MLVEACLFWLANGFSLLFPGLNMMRTNKQIHFLESNKSTIFSAWRPVSAQALGSFRAPSSPHSLFLTRQHWPRIPKFTRKWLMALLQSTIQYSSIYFTCSSFSDFCEFTILYRQRLKGLWSTISSVLYWALSQKKKRNEVSETVRFRQP